MKKRKFRGDRGGARRGNEQNPAEWVGGVRESPHFVLDRDPPWRPLIALWIDLPSGLVVGHELVDPDEAGRPLEAALRGGLERAQLDPRQIGRFRVESEELAREVRNVAGDDAEIIVAPTPELDDVLAFLAKGPGEDRQEESYLGEDRIPPGTTARLFDAAGFFYAMAPWKMAGSDQILRMDLPALGIEGACVSTLGAGGSEPGFLIFPSLDGFESFLSSADPSSRGRGPIDVGTTWLSFQLQEKNSLSETMQAEIAHFGWPLAPGDLCPLVQSHDHDLVIKPLTSRDVEIAWRCAIGLSTFVARNGSIFRERGSGPASESSEGRDGIPIRFTYPFDAYDEFEESPGSEATELDPYVNVGRNEPCPCGSGRKYKKCHLPEHEEQRRRFKLAARCHDVDAEVLFRLLDVADDRLGDRYLDELDRLGEVTRDTSNIAHAWLVYDALFDGQTVAEMGAEHFVAEAREWLTAQQAAWFSVWEVLEVEPGQGLRLRDLITGVEKRVVEREASRLLVSRDAFLVRVVDYRGISLLCAAHSRPLPPREAAEVVRRARKRLRRKSPPPPDRLRNGEFSRYLIRSWQRQVRTLDSTPRRIPNFRNADDDPVLLTTDHFEILPGRRRSLEERLASMPEVAPPPDPTEGDGWTFLRPAGEERPGETMIHRVFGIGHVSAKRLTIETDSVARADDLRERVENACGDLLRHLVREHSDPVSRALSRSDDSRPAEPPPTPSPEMLEAMLEYKKQHYATWIDEPVPALGGRTPRDVAQTAEGRRELDVLLKEMENMEQRGAPEPRYDFSEIRRSLELD